MSLKNLEHDGNEDFLKVNETFPDRKKDAIKKEKNEIRAEEAEEKAIEKQQEEWMSFNNPFLWDGEI